MVEFSGLTRPDLNGLLGFPSSTGSGLQGAHVNGKASLVPLLCDIFAYMKRICLREKNSVQTRSTTGSFYRAPTDRIHPLQAQAAEAAGCCRPRLTSHPLTAWRRISGGSGRRDCGRASSGCIFHRPPKATIILKRGRGSSDKNGNTKSGTAAAQQNSGMPKIFFASVLTS